MLKKNNDEIQKSPAPTVDQRQHRSQAPSIADQSDSVDPKEQSDSNTALDEKGDQRKIESDLPKDSDRELLRIWRAARSHAASDGDETLRLSPMSLISELCDTPAPSGEDGMRRRTALHRSLMRLEGFCAGSRLAPAEVDESLAVILDIAADVDAGNLPLKEILAIHQILHPSTDAPLPSTPSPADKSDTDGNTPSADRKSKDDDRPKEEQQKGATAKEEQPREAAQRSGAHDAPADHTAASDGQVSRQMPPNLGGISTPTAARRHISIFDLAASAK